MGRRSGSREKEGEELREKNEESQKTKGSRSRYLNSYVLGFMNGLDVSTVVEPGGLYSPNCIKGYIKERTN